MQCIEISDVFDWDSFAVVSLGDGDEVEVAIDLFCGVY